MLQETLRQTLSDIAPYLVSADRIKWTPASLLFEAYSWVNFLIPALAGIGVTVPILSQLVQSKTANASEFLSSTGPWGYVILALCVAWLVLKYLVEREDGLKRKTLMRVCRKDMIPKEAFVTRALQNADPKEKLQKVLEELQGIYDRANQQDAWPWPGKFCPNCEPAANRRVQEWVQNWRQRHEPITQNPVVSDSGLAIPAVELRAET